MQIHILSTFTSHEHVRKTLSDIHMDRRSLELSTVSTCTGSYLPLITNVCTLFITDLNHPMIFTSCKMGIPLVLIHDTFFLHHFILYIDRNVCILKIEYKTGYIQGINWKCYFCDLLL